jgi:hypothetical protein
LGAIESCWTWEHDSCIRAVEACRAGDGVEIGFIGDVGGDWTVLASVTRDTRVSNGR